MSTIDKRSMDELSRPVGEVVEGKLRDTLGDPDQRFALRPEIQERLTKSLNQPKNSRQAVPRAAVAPRLGLDW